MPDSITEKLLDHLTDLRDRATAEAGIMQQAIDHIQSPAVVLNAASLTDGEVRGLFGAATHAQGMGRLLADFEEYRDGRAAVGMQALDIHGFSAVWRVGRDKEFTRPQFDEALRRAEDEAGLMTTTAGC